MRKEKKKCHVKCLVILKATKYSHHMAYYEVKDNGHASCSMFNQIFAMVIEFFL